MDREELIEKCKDYQDLSAMGYERARRWRDREEADHAIIVSMQTAAYWSARARRILFYLVTNDPRELFEP